MALKLIGAGVGRTGTHSLKQALEHLLGGPCYHMSELFGRDDDIAVWHAAARGEPADLNAMLDGYEATVDWPAAAFWPELTAANPDAVVLLSLRSRVPDGDVVVAAEQLGHVVAGAAEQVFERLFERVRPRPADTGADQLESHGEIIRAPSTGRF